ncbi:hypothetical protein KUCAC02_002684, partial [Chaenocephalus aceratus]
LCFLPKCSQFACRLAISFLLTMVYQREKQSCAAPASRSLSPCTTRRKLPHTSAGR